MYRKAIISGPYLVGVLGVPEHPPNFGGSGKGRSLISAFYSLAITTNTPGFEKLNTALPYDLCITTLVLTIAPV